MFELRELAMTGKVARRRAQAQQRIELVRHAFGAEAGDEHMSDATNDHAPASSPCIQICRLDANGLCVGCLRTLGEIAEWSGATNARRHEILQELKLRATRAP
jgi:uncharacterized protein